MPPSGFNRDSVRGALIFVKGCYNDLLADVNTGKFKTYEEAIEYELGQIDKALGQLHIDQKGNLFKK
jgi:hypothetical protein